MDARSSDCRAELVSDARRVDARDRSERLPHHVRAGEWGDLVEWSVVHVARRLLRQRPNGFWRSWPRERATSGLVHRPGARPSGCCGRHRWRGRARSGNPGCFVRNRDCRTAPQTGNVQGVRTCWTRDTPNRQQIHRQLELRLNDCLRGGHDRAALGGHSRTLAQGSESRFSARYRRAKQFRVQFEVRSSEFRPRLGFPGW